MALPLNPLYRRIVRVTAYRAQPGAPGGFTAQNPTFFDRPTNATVIEDMRVQFEVEKSVDREPNKCGIKITNLAETTRANLEHRPLAVRLEAGYNETPRYLFVGDVRHAYSELDGVNWITHLQLADGDRAFRYAQVSKTYRRGGRVADAVRDAAAAMGIKLEAKDLASPDLQKQFASGHTLQGSARDELTRLLAPYGFRWSFQDGRFQMLRDSDTRADQAVLVSEETGMIGSPSFSLPDKPGKPPTLRVKMLLYPELTPGAQIQVRSRDVNGIFRIERVTHSGGNLDDDDFTSEIEAKARL